MDKFKLVDKLNKKHLLIIIPILLLVIILPFLLLKSGKIGYLSEVEKDIEFERLNEFVYLLDPELLEDIEENIDPNKLYDEISKINNFQYYSNLAEFFNKADKKLKEEGSSFVTYYNSGIGINEILMMTLGEEYTNFTKAYLLGSYKNEEYSEKLAKNLYLRSLNHLSKHEHKKVLEEFETILEDHKFTEPVNYKIGRMYHDVKLLNDMNSINNTNYIEILSSLKDPGAFTVEVMRLFITDRELIITDKNSPCLYDSTVINISEITSEIVDSKTEDETLKMMYNLYAADRTEIEIFKVKFQDTVDNNSFTTYVVGDNWYQNYVLYTIKSDDTSLDLRTLSEYKKDYDEFDSELRI